MADPSSSLETLSPAMAPVNLDVPAILLAHYDTELGDLLEYPILQSGDPTGG